MHTFNECGNHEFRIFPISSRTYRWHTLFYFIQVKTWYLMLEYSHHSHLAKTIHCFFCLFVRLSFVDLLPLDWNQFSNSILVTLETSSPNISTRTRIRRKERKRERKLARLNEIASVECDCDSDCGCDPNCFAIWVLFASSSSSSALSTFAEWE